MDGKKEMERQEEKTRVGRRKRKGTGMEREL